MKGIFSLKYEFSQSYWCLIHGILRPSNTVFAFLGHEGQPPPEVVEGGWRAFHEGAIFSTVSPPRAGKELALGSAHGAVGMPADFYWGH